MLRILVSSAAGSAVNHVQKKTSNIAAGYFNSYDSFDAKILYLVRSLRSLTFPKVGTNLNYFFDNVKGTRFNPVRRYF